ESRDDTGDRVQCAVVVPGERSGAAVELRTIRDLEDRFEAESESSDLVATLLGYIREQNGPDPGDIDWGSLVRAVETGIGEDGLQPTARRRKQRVGTVLNQFVELSPLIAALSRRELDIDLFFK